MLELSPVEANMCSLSALTFIMVKFPFRAVFSTFLLLSIMAWRQEGVAEAVGVKMSCYFIHEAAPTCSKARKRKKKKEINPVSNSSTGEGCLKHSK